MLKQRRSLLQPRLKRGPRALPPPRCRNSSSRSGAESSNKERSGGVHCYRAVSSLSYEKQVHAVCGVSVHSFHIFVLYLYRKRQIWFRWESLVGMFSKYLVIYVILYQKINKSVGFKRKRNMMSEFLPFLQKHWQHDFKHVLFPCAVVANDMQWTPAPKKKQNNPVGVRWFYVE